MAKNETKKQTTETNDGLTLIVGGLFVLFLVFATYSYFNKSNKTEIEDEMSDNTVVQDDTLTNANDNDLSIGERIKELFNSRKGELNEDAASDMETDTETATGTGGQIIPDMTTWQANDYEQGDIKGDKYEVVYGDTLWEIAEAVYGDGSMWTKIVEANSGSVGYLPNGQQALIMAGQTLVIPQ